jgi:hypothetical protein
VAGNVARLGCAWPAMSSSTRRSFSLIRRKMCPRGAEIEYHAEISDNRPAPAGRSAWILWRVSSDISCAALGTLLRVSKPSQAQYFLVGAYATRECEFPGRVESSFLFS